MKLFINYLKTKRNIIIFFVLTMLFLIISFCLYRLPIEAITYPLIIVVITGIVILIIDFEKQKKIHNQLVGLLNLNCEMIDNLPIVNSILEEDYSKLIDKLKKEIYDTKTNDLLTYNKMIDYYTVWAHQIKTPIASMKLKLENDDTKLSHYLNLDLLHISQYVDMVLDFLRLDSENSDFVFKEYDIDELIKPVLRKYANEFIYRKLSLEYETINKIIVTDKKWFSLMIEQFISNSLKYTKEGFIKIYLIENKLCIEDSGIGIRKEDIPRIFEKGFTGNNGRINKESSGLGLYLCKRVSDNLGLNISIESNVDIGTKIYIDLLQKNKVIE